MTNTINTIIGGTTNSYLHHLFEKMNRNRPVRKEIMIKRKRFTGGEITGGETPVDMIRRLNHAIKTTVKINIMDKIIEAFEICESSSDATNAIKQFCEKKRDVK